jgi:CheY-like chemotaxis protein
MRILLVEDNLINQQVALELLQAQAATVQVANNGREGVDAILQAGALPFDVVLMDLQMPVLDGMAATREIRATPGLQALPIIAMTANAMPEDREACAQVGMNDHIGKPFELGHLVQVLRRHTGWALGNEGQENAIAISDALQKTADATGVKLVPALRRLGGNLPLYTRTLGAFMADLRVLDQQLAAPGTMDRIADLAQQLHPVKGLAATTGLDRLAEVTREAEALLKRADPGAFSVALGQMRQAIAEHLPALDAMHRLLLAEAQGEADAAPAGLLPAQRMAVLDRLQRLREQLAAEDFDALNTLALIKGHAAGHLSEALEPLQEAMAQLDFEAALPQCALLISQMNTHTELSI